ncbi:Two component system response regulator [Desulfonema limicola]|uniref:Two component system response regulator n=1 Tax=Desulfonema limicola TaxID=45656 RepID=A0A975BD00_9BACT|nr:response regulator [Desulfonema limicola]QTA82930.1 Two component system response regulator [Desulfonema limicola]
MKILLVDDEQELVSTIAERLEIRGIEAHWFTNASKALQSAESVSYDIAVLDVKMPVVSGLELRDLLHKRYPDMKFIFLTGHGSEEDYRLGTVDGTCYLVKPISIEILMTKIKECLSK